MKVEGMLIHLCLGENGVRLLAQSMLQEGNKAREVGGVRGDRVMLHKMARLGLTAAGEISGVMFRQGSGSGGGWGL